MDLNQYINNTIYNRIQEDKRRIFVASFNIFTILIDGGVDSGYRLINYKAHI